MPARVRRQRRHKRDDSADSTQRYTQKSKIHRIHMQIIINFLCIAMYSLNSTDTVNLQSTNRTTMAQFESNMQQSVNKSKF